MSFAETLGGAKAPRVNNFSAEKYVCSAKDVPRKSLIIKIK